MVMVTRYEQYDSDGQATTTITIHGDPSNVPIPAEGFVEVDVPADDPQVLNNEQPAEAPRKARKAKKGQPRPSSSARSTQT